jgi:anaerobic magnesium-protoporphyrin IX monomethyl ester cyclase
MRFAYIKTNVEASGYVVHGLGLLSAIGKQCGHESVWANPAVDARIPTDVDAVAITACSDAFPLARTVARFYKQNYPNVMVWVGGPHATFVPDDFGGSEFDHVVIGEGETVWRAFCQNPEGFYGGKYIQGTSPADLDALPFADRLQEQDFLNGTEHPPRPLRQFPGPYKCVLAGRGCRYNCAFCKPGTSAMFGKQSRRRSVDNVLAEIETLGELGSLFIHDDCLLEDGLWCTEFFAKWMGKPALVQARADLIVRQERLLEYLVERGLRAMLIGFESGSDRVLRTMRKGTTRAINERAAAICHRLGIVIQANMIFGVPGETREDVEATLDLIRNKLQPCIISPAVYTPYPGSDWGKLCNDNGWNLVKDSYDYLRGAGGRKLKEEAFGYTYDWLYRRLHDEAIL